MRRQVMVTVLAAVVSGIGCSQVALAEVKVDQAHRRKAKAILQKAYDYLRAQQNEDGSWLPQPGPAVTGLVVTGMLQSPSIDRYDPAVKKGIQYILSKQRPNGGIYTQILANYNTSICLAALAQVRKDAQGIQKVIEKAQEFLISLQWYDEKGPRGNPITKEHPWYGGIAYGTGGGRPDLSNTHLMLEALYASGADCSSAVFDRAMTFVTRLQGTKANTMYGDEIQPNGGFIYAIAKSEKRIGVPETEVEPPTVEGPRGKSRLRTYGSMTYAGFKSYVYATKLGPNDPRVQDALGWIKRNYTVEENPPMGGAGYYYYLQVFAKALHAWGDPVLKLADGRKVNWAEDLIEQAAKLQRNNGSFVNSRSSRWMEDEPVLCTAYMVQALQHALGRDLRHVPAQFHK